MGSRDFFRDCEYLRESYEAAAEKYDRSLRVSEYITGQDQSRQLLASAAADMCSGLTRFVEASQNSDWVEVLAHEIHDQRGAIVEAYEFFDRFLELEENVLREAGLSPAAAARLIADTARSIAMAEGTPDLRHVENLRARLSDCAKQVCASQRLLEAQPLNQGPWLSALRPVGGGLLVLGGATTMYANAISALAMPIFVASMATGLGTIGGGLVAFNS